MKIYPLFGKELNKKQGNYLFQWDKYTWKFWGVAFKHSYFGLMKRHKSDTSDYVIRRTNEHD